MQTLRCEMETTKCVAIARDMLVPVLSDDTLNESEFLWYKRHIHTNAPIVISINTYFQIKSC